jgi:hypothetical protein
MASSQARPLAKAVDSDRVPCRYPHVATDRPNTSGQETQMSSKSEVMERTILRHSRHKPFRAAAQEWHLLTISPTLDGFASCEACGTPIRKSASIRNDVTGATLVIGLTCYDHFLGILRSAGVRMRLVGRQAFIRFYTQAAEQRVAERYRSYVEGVHVRSWRKWLLSEVPSDRVAPAEVRRAVDQLLSANSIPRQLSFHPA